MEISALKEKEAQFIFSLLGRRFFSWFSSSTRFLFQGLILDGKRCINLDLNSYSECDKDMCVLIVWFCF